MNKQERLDEIEDRRRREQNVIDKEQEQENKRLHKMKIEKKSEFNKEVKRMLDSKDD